MTLDEALAACPVVAILRGVRTDEVLDHVAALYDAGVRAVETPLNSADPIGTIRRIAEAYGGRMCCGGGTVLRPEQVEAVSAAGGRVIVAPNTDARVILQAVKLGLVPVAGFATASEALAALAAGARRLKLFPAITYGPAHLRQLKVVLPPDVSVWAVGGVAPDSMAAWWTAGARAFGVGGELYKAGQTPAETMHKARRVVEATLALPA